MVSIIARMNAEAAATGETTRLDTTHLDMSGDYPQPGELFEVKPDSSTLVRTYIVVAVEPDRDLIWTKDDFGNSIPFTSDEIKVMK